MLTLEDIIRVTRRNTQQGRTGTHVFGRGHQRLDGTFSDESRRRGRRLQKKYPLKKGSEANGETDKAPQKKEKKA